MILENFDFAILQNMSVERLRAFLHLVEAIYHAYAENAAVTAKRIIFNDTMFRILENISLERYRRIFLLGASKSPTIFSNVICRGCREASY